VSLYSDPFGDQDKAASDQQVTKVYKPSSQKDALSYKDIDEGHGGINQTVVQADGAAGATSASVHNSSCPTAAEAGIN
jgi:hypothetical protein